jgi:hypothetical protein
MIMVVQKKGSKLEIIKKNKQNAHQKVNRKLIIFSNLPLFLFSFIFILNFIYYISFSI